MIWHDQERARRLLLSRTHKKLIQLHTLSLPRNNLKESGHCQTGRKSQVRLISKSNERPKKKKKISTGPIVFIAFPKSSTNSPPTRLESSWALCGPREEALQVAFSIFHLACPPTFLAFSFSFLLQDS